MPDILDTIDRLEKEQHKFLKERGWDIVCRPTGVSIISTYVKGKLYFTQIRDALNSEKGLP